MTDERFDVVEALEAYAAERSISLLDVAIGGLAAQPAVASVIAGATSPDQVKANVAAGALAAHRRRPRRPRRHRPAVPLTFPARLSHPDGPRRSVPPDRG